jgi:tripartite-type tricarboxylate transporter receptor subunit TctC
MCYKGSAPAATDLFGGQIQFVFEAIGAGVQYVKTGRLRALGVSTLKRSLILPDLPTISEQGVTGYEMSTWHSVAAPRGTPPAVIEKLHREISASINSAEVREKFVAAGTEPQSSTPEQLRERIAQEIPRWNKLLNQLGLK